MPNNETPVRGALLASHGTHRAATIVAILLLWCHAVCGFDTGHHSDLTYEVLHQAGFATTPVEIAQVQNWLVDYYTSSPTSTIIEDVAPLHFDNLFSIEAIDHDWRALTINTHAAVQNATRERDAIQLLTLIGASLHAVQDFYSHSNWVETHPRDTAAYRSETWFNSPPSPDGPPLYTGSWPTMKLGATELHGDYYKGLNKDSYVRPHWDEAYVFAYVASREWVEAIRSWVVEVDPGFWETVKTLDVSDADKKALKRDLEAAYRLSEWICSEGVDGCWKGNGSGSKVDFLSFAPGWLAAPDSLFVKEFKQRRIPRLLSHGSAHPATPPGPMPKVPTPHVSSYAVIVRTLRVAERKVGFFDLKIDPHGSADFYAKITVDGQTFKEAMQLNRREAEPQWTTLKFVPTGAASVPIRYELWDEDGLLAGKDDHCDIHPERNHRDLTFTFDLGTHYCSGDVNGVHDTPDKVMFSSGLKDSDRAEVEFYVTAASVE